PAHHDFTNLPDVFARTLRWLESRPGQRSFLALRPAPADGRGNPRFDSSHQRFPEFQNVWARRLRGNSKGSARGPIASRPELGEIIARRTGAAKYLHSRQALAHHADPGELRSGGDGSLDAGAVLDRPADAG